jgi:putative transposase
MASRFGRKLRSAGLSRLRGRRDKDGWSCLLQDLRTRGVSHIDLLVTDGHDGLLAAVASLFPATPRQRCLVHKQRNVLNAIPKREQQDVITELTGIWKQENKESALLNLAASTRQIPEALSRSRAQPLRR